MSFVATPQMWVPHPLAPNSNAPAYASGLTIDAAIEKVAFVFRAPKTGTLDKFEFRLNIVTQAPANGLKASFQDVSLTDGFPDGAVDQFRVVTSGLVTNAWIAPGLMTSDGTDLGSKRSVTMGDVLACVIEFQSFNASDSLGIATLSHDSLGGFSMFPYTAHNTGSWTKPGNNMGVMALKYNDGSYAYIGGDIYPFNNLITTNFSTGSTPSERGLIFQFPVAVKVAGAWIRLTSAASNTARLRLYDSDGTSQLESILIDSDAWAGVGGKTAFYWFTQERELLASTSYRLALLPETGTNFTIYEFSVSAAALMDGVEGGQNWYLTTRSGAGAWSPTTTQRPFMGLLVTAIDTGGSGGSGSVLRGSVVQ